jgi:site-specific DNA-methyltransferase (adenine-specific)
MIGMQQYPDKWFDLAVVDPPYFEDYGKQNYTGNDISTTGIKRQTSKIKNWDIPDENYFNELIRISKHQIIWGCNYYAKFIPSFGRIVWDKKNESSTFSKCEIASHSFGVIVDKFTYMWNGMLQQNMKQKEQRIHPTQKPIALYDWIYKNYLPNGGKVIDTHLGSGSNRIAADKAGNIDFIAFELDTDYFNAQEKRWNDYKAQLKLF